MRITDLVGMKFGRLVVLSRAEYGVSESNGKRYSRWNCVCDCGNFVTVRQHSLIQGNTKSCGCLSLDSRRERGLEGWEVTYKTLPSSPTLQDIMRCIGESGPDYSKEQLILAVAKMFPAYWQRQVRTEQMVIRKRKIRDGTSYCEMCGKPCKPEVHHIIPVSDYGGNNDENIMWLCKSCHKKVGKTDE